ncbi:MAG TPA: phosphatase PAP2 family protein [Candidatus Limnocylindria bacterium]|nr:phosphatase PAP2 family protein [Candidatus Limnocylindria bacterium]
MSRLVVHDEAEHHLGGAVPSPAVAFLLAILALPALFWLVMLKRTTVYTAPEEWLMSTVVPALHAWVQTNLPPVETLIVAISALGSGWFVALAFAGLGLLALARGRRDLALLMALGTLCFPMEWALKFFVSPEAITLPVLVQAMFNVNDIGLDDIADFPAGHALRATVLYGLAAFSVARLAHDVRQGQIAYAVAAVLIGAISATRIYLGAHFPMDVLGGWMAGGALVAILVAIHVLGVDERARAREAAELAARRRSGQRRVAVPRRPKAAPAPARGDGVEG